MVVPQQQAWRSETSAGRSWLGLEILTMLEALGEQGLGVTRRK
jgi:hypothetical protein